MTPMTPARLLGAAVSASYAGELPSFALPSFSSGRTGRAERQRNKSATMARRKITKKKTGGVFRPRKTSAATPLSLSLSLSVDLISSDVGGRFCSFDSSNIIKKSFVSFPFFSCVGGVRRKRMLALTEFLFFCSLSLSFSLSFSLSLSLSLSLFHIRVSPRCYSFSDALHRPAPRRPGFNGFQRVSTGFNGFQRVFFFLPSFTQFPS